MYLKQLDIIGFKSFADKTRLTFEPGMIAIVGPNGCGKSNVSDAIRWVLGEQSSKTLRGGKMEDVIFSGTQFRKPMGFASVTLNIINNRGILQIPSEQVSVTRKLYRSGESEYMINGAQVRLKDICELFMDTGLGRDGYSIIGQGRVAEVVSAIKKPRQSESLPLRRKTFSVCVISSANSKAELSRSAYSRKKRKNSSNIPKRKSRLRSPSGFVSLTTLRKILTKFPTSSLSARTNTTALKPIFQGWKKSLHSFPKICRKTLSARKSCETAYSNRNVQTRRYIPISLFVRTKFATQTMISTK